MSGLKSFPISETIRIGGNDSNTLLTSSLPCDMQLLSDCGIVVCHGIDGKIVYEDPDGKGTYEVRGTFTPGGDMLIMFPCGEHYTSRGEKPNTMLMLRSTDSGKTWQSPTEPFDIPYAQHGFIPLIPKGGKRIYCFGTQPIKDEYTTEGGLGENAPIGYFYSDDDGHTWSGPVLIRPEEDPSYRGMSVTRMCETERGTWLLGSHEAYWGEKPLKTYQYILRSEDKGETWHILPDKRRNGWQCTGFGRMDEGRPISFGGDSVLAMFRTPEGHLWASWSHDDGKTWSAPEASKLVHPDAPPMVFTLSDGSLACFHHNRHHDRNYSGLSGDKAEIMADRSEIWVSFSKDGGHNWSEPRLVFANACIADYPKPFFNYQCSYIDVISDGGKLHILVPHLWHRILHLTVTEDDLYRAPTKEELFMDRNK